MERMGSKIIELQNIKNWTMSSWIISVDFQPERRWNIGKNGTGKPFLNLLTVLPLDGGKW
jgi:hypothetical protein